jgi:hypothetical protein
MNTPRLYDGMDSECYYGRHKFLDGFCTRPGCKVDQNNIINLSAARWFERTNGNTYHSATLTLPNGKQLRVPYAYGYGNQYEDTALGLLVEHFGDQKREGERLFPYLTTKGYYSIVRVSDVSRKKDL